MKIKELKTDIGVIKDLELSFGRVIEETWDEPVGPTPFPSIIELREWDHTILQRYKPLYLPHSDVCDLCTLGKCDLTAGKRGACGIDIATQQSRLALLTACIGTATHIAHSRHLVEHLIEKYGSRFPIDVGGMNIQVEAPITRLVCGVRPKTLSDFEQVLDYLENQTTHLLAAVHTGQEGKSLDFESKVLHAGMLDHVALEIGDIAQVTTFGFPKADPEAPLVEIGGGVVETRKPVILCIGHNVATAVEIVDYLRANDLLEKVEVCGLCCTAQDMARYNSNTKIIGPISWQLRFIRSGMADVIVIDEQCVRVDSLAEAIKIKAPVIVTMDKICLDLPNRTKDPAEKIVADLADQKIPGALILEPSKAGEVAVRTALQVAPKRKKFKSIPDITDVIEGAKRCTLCRECRRACPNDLLIPEAMKVAAKGNLDKLADLYEDCIGCGKCESACPEDIAAHSFIVKAAETQMKQEKYTIQAGRGAIQDVEIRNVGSPIVLGEIPGVVGFVGCANFPHGRRDVAEMCAEFANRRYIVVTSGCAAMSSAMYKDAEGQTIYEAHSKAFEAGGVINVGSCVANAHIAGAAIKIASIFAKRNLRANYEEIADYILNRVGAVGVAWGAYAQKAFAIGSGCWRLGIPVIVGPHGSKYKRMLLGRKDRKEDWYVYDARTGDRVYVGPTPEHLFVTAESKEEAMVMIAKLCMRPNDTTRGRSIKLANYIDLHRHNYGVMPDDIHSFVRTLADVPITMKDEIIKVLDEKKWVESRIPDPTLLSRLIRKRREVA
ncbi:MAG: CO dehydrogenase/acetyl-CoA synthase complex subunit alpha [Candidatus Bathyarchaeia archaeon]